MRSTFPSPFRSAGVKGPESLPSAVDEPGAVVKPPAPLPRRIVRLFEVPHGTARSGLPSPLKSAAAIAPGPSQTLTAGAAVKRPFPLPSKMMTSSETQSARARSGAPSRLTSATAALHAPVVAAGAGAKDGSAARAAPVRRVASRPSGARTPQRSLLRSRVTTSKKSRTLLLRFHQRGVNS